ncbi:hypothetical protein Cgig2_028850 [Carnegiea gigantea]|uniref:GDSL esterase/lipase n=1 Tax=Carnegiea gigantea TaxID=171969 RepID=A0A9Q1QN68_9CARY|nr:hypothetical protein Cgig2_028850 [Carnegiea gigantea]
MPMISGMFLGNNNNNMGRLSIISFLSFFLLYLIHGSAQPGSGLIPTSVPKGPKNSVSAILVFGDSTADPGNNNYITTPFKSNFAPYGKDFPSRMPTGSYAGLKEFVPAYLDTTLNVAELMTGVSFASAGSGYDPLTPRLSGVIPMSKQLEYFKEYISKIEIVLGPEKTKEHISKAVCIVSAVTNDFVVNYFTVPVRRKMYTIAQYQQFLVENVHQFVQSLWELGVRKIAVSGGPPIGCLPVVITLKSNSGGCIDSLSAVVQDYNKLLQEDIQALHHTLANNKTSKIVYIDTYTPLTDILKGLPSKYGFEEVRRGCCGTGYVEASFLCNPSSPVCHDPSKYAFWDSIHPTEMAYFLIFRSCLPAIDYIISDY